MSLSTTERLLLHLPTPPSVLSPPLLPLRLFRTSLPLLLLSALPLALCLPDSRLFLSHHVQHAQNPLRVSGGLSTLQCASWCLRTSGCIKWSLDAAGEPCRLWPLHSSSNALTADREPLYQTKLPEGFAFGTDPAVAYKSRSFQLVGGRTSVVASCREYDPESTPAVPRSQLQYDSMKKLTMTSLWFYIGVWEPETEGEFCDMVSGERVDVPAAWFRYGVVHRSTTNNCMMVSSYGMFTSNCAYQRNGHICEYRPHDPRGDTFE